MSETPQALLDWLEHRERALRASLSKAAECASLADDIKRGFALAAQQIRSGTAALPPHRPHLWEPYLSRAGQRLEKLLAVKAHQAAGMRWTEALRRVGLPSTTAHVWNELWQRGGLLALLPGTWRCGRAKGSGLKAPGKDGAVYFQMPVLGRHQIHFQLAVLMTLRRQGGRTVLEVRLAKRRPVRARARRSVAIEPS